MIVVWKRSLETTIIMNISRISSNKIQYFFIFMKPLIFFLFVLLFVLYVPKNQIYWNPSSSANMAIAFMRKKLYLYILYKYFYLFIKIQADGPMEKTPIITQQKYFKFTLKRIRDKKNESYKIIKKEQYYK